MENFKTKDGAEYRWDGAHYYKSTHTAKNGDAIWNRIGQEQYEAARTGAVDEPSVSSAAAPEPQDAAPAGVPAGLYELRTVLPDTLTDAEWERLNSLFESKLNLECRAFGSDDLMLERKDGRIILSGNFPNGVTPQIASASMQYLIQLVGLAKKLQRVNHSGPDLPENERYAFRTWLLRLGFIGPEFKESRATLLENLPGSAAFRDGKRKEES